MICLVCGRPSIDALTHPRCRGHYTIDGCFAIVSYSGIIKKLLYQYKYRPNLSDLRSFLAALFYEGMIQNELLYKQLDNALLVPVPLHAVRLRSRGYDQVALLTKNVSKLSDLPAEQLLRRVKKTSSQYGLKREERVRNMKDAFEVLNNNAKEKTLLLVDDIVTSGTTLAEAARVLKKAGYGKVYGLAFAHGQ